MVALVGATEIPAILAQSTEAHTPRSDHVRPLQPGGLLSDKLGEYQTIEGVLSEGLKTESGTLLVDTVNGQKLAKPIPLLIRGAVIVNHNLQPASLSIPPKQRCKLKGFELGEMIGVAPAVMKAANEQGWKETPLSPVAWQWRPYFVALVVVEPQGLNLSRQ